MTYIDHRIVEDGNKKFALTDMTDIGKYVAEIVSDPRTLNRCVFVYTEVLSMNEIWDVMAKASGETPPKEYVSDSPIFFCKVRIAHLIRAWLNVTSVGIGSRNR